MAGGSLGSATLDLRTNDTQYNSGMDSAERRARGLQGTFKRARGKINQHSRAIGTGMVFAAGLLVKSAVDIESGMIGVQKTTGLTDDKIKQLKEQMLDFATKNNVTVDSLLETLKVSGQMGIEGVNNISRFTQAFAKLEVASDRTVQGELGAQAFAKFLDLSGEGIKGAESMGSALVQLGNTSKTTEGKVLKTATEIVKKTNRFKLGGANILGLATAMDEAGVQSEVAGSTMLRFFESLNAAVISGGERLEIFQDVTGRSREQLRKMIETNPAQALVEFAEGLNKANQEGANTEALLQGVNLGGIRTGSTMNVLATRVEQMKDKMQSANEAQRENVALQRETDAANRGAAAATQRFVNKLKQLADKILSSGLLDGLTEMLGLVGKGIDLFIDFGKSIGEFAAKAVQAFDDWVASFKADQRTISIFINDAIDQFADLKDKVVEAVKNLVSGIGNWFKDLPDKMVSIAQTAVTDTVQAFVSMETDAIAAVSGMVDGIGQWFKDLPGKMVDKAKESVKGVVEWFKWGSDEAVGNSIIPDMVKAIGKTMAGLVGAMVPPTKAATVGVVAEFDAFGDKTIQSTADMSTGVVTEAQSMGDSLLNIAETFGIDWLRSIGDTVTGTIGKFQRVYDTVTGLLNDIGNVWQGLSDMFGSGFFDGLTKIFSSAGSSAGSSFGSGFLTKAGTAIKGLFSSGGAISGSTVVGPAASAGTAAGGSFATAAMAMMPAAAVIAMPFVLAAAYGEGAVDKMIKKASKQFDGFSATVGETAIGMGEDFGFATSQSLGFLEQIADKGEVISVRLGEDITAFKNLSEEQLRNLVASANAEFTRMQRVGADVFGEMGVDAQKMGDMLQDGVIDTAERAALEIQDLGDSIKHPKTGMMQLGDISTTQMARLMDAVQSGELRMDALTGGVKLTQGEFEVLGDIGLSVSGDIVEGITAAGKSTGDLSNRVIDVAQEVERFGGTAMRSFGDASESALSFGTVADDEVTKVTDSARDLENVLHGRSITTAFDNVARAAKGFGRTSVRSLRDSLKEAKKLEDQLHGNSLHHAFYDVEEASQSFGEKARRSLGSINVRAKLASDGTKTARGGMHVTIQQTIAGADSAEVERQTRRALNKFALEWEFV